MRDFAFTMGVVCTIGALSTSMLYALVRGYETIENDAKDDREANRD